MIVVFEGHPKDKILETSLSWRPLLQDIEITKVYIAYLSENEVDDSTMS